MRQGLREAADSLCAPHVPTTKPQRAAWVGNPHQVSRGVRRELAEGAGGSPPAGV